MCKRELFNCTHSNEIFTIKNSNRFRKKKMYLITQIEFVGLEEKKFKIRSIE